jgi:Flp pilus assembly protein TadG
MVLVALFLLALLNVDVFDVVRGKNRVQNGGDAAALAAARHRMTAISARCSGFTPRTFLSRAAMSAQTRSICPSMSFAPAVSIWLCASNPGR